MFPKNQHTIEHETDYFDKDVNGIVEFLIVMYGSNLASLLQDMNTEAVDFSSVILSFVYSYQSC